MPKTIIGLGVVPLLVACNSNVNMEPQRADDSAQPGIHDVTERGVVDRTTGDAQLVESAAPGWWELHAGPVRELLPHQSTAPDTSVYHFGRSGATLASRDTPVAMALSGLEPWRNGDSIQLMSPNAGFSIWALDIHFAPPAEGAAAVTDRSVNWRQTFAPLIDPAQGDTTYVAQMSDRVSADHTHYAVMARVGVADAFAVVDGQPASLATTLAALPQDRSVAMHYRASAYAALANQAGPYTHPARGAGLSIKALPEPLASNNSLWRNYYLYLPSLVEVWGASGSRDFDETIHYGSPFHDNWTDVVTLEYPMHVLVPGVGGLTARVVQAMPVDALAAAPLAPALSPVRNARIGGHPLDADVSGVGQGATVTWDAPAVGTANNYSVTVQQIVRVDQGYQIRPVATFYTRQPSLQIPEIATNHASSYLLVITAISAPDRDLTVRPLVGALPFASTDYVTGRITP